MLDIADAGHRDARARGTTLDGDCQIITHQGKRWVVPHSRALPPYVMPGVISLPGSALPGDGHPPPSVPRAPGESGLDPALPRARRQEIAGELARRAAKVSQDCQSLAEGSRDVKDDRSPQPGASSSGLDPNAEAVIGAVGSLAKGLKRKQDRDDDSSSGDDEKIVRGSTPGEHSRVLAIAQRKPGRLLEMGMSELKKYPGIGTRTRIQTGSLPR